MADEERNMPCAPSEPGPLRRTKDKNEGLLLQAGPQGQARKRPHQDAQ